MTRLLAPLLLLLLAVSPAAAADLSVSPLRVDLATDAPIGQVALVNTASTPVVMEAQLWAWDQDASGKWTSAPATGVDIYPAQVVIAPGAQGYVRVGLSNPATPPGAYRLVLQELADPARARPGTVQILTRISLPVFVLPAPAARQSAARLTARFTGQALSLVLENAGNMPIAPQRIELEMGGRATTAALPGYALPGRTLSWSTPWVACKPGQSLQLRLVEQDLIVSTPIEGCR